ncbi:MAG: DUF1326 domain-containing protein [Vicinamibacterales bacterium]|jgi:hypothetical protein
MPQWWAKGLIFENCACTLVCPGHMHFSQLCTHERCKGYWALRFDDGAFGEVTLAGLRAVIAFDTPQRMIDGNWVQALIIDEAATSAQREALATILTGQAGGPWAKLAGFVATQLPIEFRHIDMADEGATKRVTIADRLKAFVTQIRGRDKSKPVLFENIFNQIHAPTQVVALGDTEYGDGRIVIRNAESHGLFSDFDWSRR